MRHSRPHRFPPLAQLNAPAQARAGAPLLPGNEVAAAADGFQQGMDRGYTQGYDSGLQAGREDGHLAGLAQGREEGRAQGHADVLARFEPLAQPLDAALQALQQLRADYQAALRREVVELVAKVARQVIRSELVLQPLQLLAMVDETLATLPRARDEDVEIYLNPEELQRIAELAPERAQRWKLLPDARLEPGEIQVKAGSHEADAGCRQRQAAVMEQISTQLLEPAEAEAQA